MPRTDLEGVSGVSHDSAARPQKDLRFVVKSVVGEKNFVDMHPNRSNNYCCGGGGGFLQSGFKDAYWLTAA